MFISRISKGGGEDSGHDRHLSSTTSQHKSVLHILNSPDPGGVLALAQSIADGIGTRGFRSEMQFLTPRPNLSPLAKMKGAFGAMRRIMRQDHEAVIAYQAWPSIVVGLTGLLARRPKLIVHQTTVPSETKAPIRLLSRLLGSLGLYPVNIVNTRFTQSQFDGFSRRYRSYLHLIEHGVECPVITRSRQETLRRFDIPDEGRILLNTARLAQEKNQGTIIRALPFLPDCGLVVAGDGDKRGELQELARALGVEERVHLLGALPHHEAVQLYGAADLFVFPSLHETFGISPVEAALLGVPTMVSDIAVLREVLTVEGRSAVSFVGATDVEAWVRELRRWTQQPPAAGDRMDFGQALARRYSEQRMIDSYVELLNAPDC